MTRPRDVFFYYPNIIGYIRVICVVSSWYFAETQWQISSLLYVLAFAGDAVDGLVARKFNQTSRFGAVLDMVTDRASSAGLLMVLSRLYGSTEAFFFVLLMFIDLFSHWTHMESVSGHHKAATSLSGRNFLIRAFYGLYPFFAFCCVGTEFFYVLLYLLHFVPGASLGALGLDLSLHSVCFFVCLPACICKQAVNVAQFCSAAFSLAEEDAHKP